jgi:hypothetical protein
MLMAEEILTGFAKVAGPSDMSSKNQAGPIFFFGVPDLMSGTKKWPL